MKKKLKILMVEDSIEDAEVIQYALKEAGFNFRAKIVNKRIDFIRHISDFSPHIILSDFSMPKFDGLSALKIARRKVPNTPFVFVSGTIGEERAIEAVKNGATDYILKDNLMTMAPKIKRALREAKVRLDKINAKRKLEVIARQLTEAQEVAQIGCWEYDLEQESVYWSTEVYKILGFIPGSVTPSINLFLSQIIEDELNTVSSIREYSYQNFKDFAYYTKIKRNDNDQIRWIHVNAKFKLNKNGAGEKVFGTIQDVTTLKETELKLEETNNELKTFIYKASHDLRGPIASVLGLCNVARDEYNPKKYIEYIDLINGRMQQMDRAINALIESMKVKDQTLRVTKVNFNKIINEILHQYKYMEGASDISFKVDIGDVKFLSYPSIISSMLQKIIENAIKYRSIINPEVIIKIKNKMDFIQIIVTDNGEGIPDEIKDKIFDMFFRGNLKSKGTGLGLYIVKNALNRLNGTVEVDSIYGKGTQFKILLPV